MPFVSCSKFNQSQATQDQAIADLEQELLNKQNALNDCSGNPLAGTVPTCAQMNTAISSAIAGGTSPTGAAGGDLQGTYPNPTVKDQAIADAVIGSTAVQNAVAGVFDDCSGNALEPRSRLIECSAKGTDIPYLVSGVIPATQLPAYVDDVLEFPALANFPATGEAGKIYIDASTGKTYRWNGTGYTEISASAGITVQDEGSVLTTAATSLNFVGTGVTATSSGGAVTVTVPSATTTQSGTSELATDAETIAGISNTTVVTPAGLKAVTDSLSLPTDTYTFAGSGRPTGTPANNGGSSYAQNAEGELFLYNGTKWVLIGNGVFKEVFQTHSPVIVIPDNTASNTVIYKYIAPRAGVILVSGMIVGSVSDARMTTPSRMSIEATVARNGTILHRFGSSISYYLAGDGIRASGSCLLAVNQGTVLTLGCTMNEVSGSTDTFLVDTSGFSTLYVQ